LYKLYAKAMLNVAYRIVNNQDEAEDILQEAFLDAFTKIHDFRQETTFGLWLKQIVINRSINMLRKRKMELIQISDEVIDSIAEEEACDEGDLQYKVSQIKDVMKHLPDHYRVIISLYLFEGYDHEEIGEILKINENTSRTQFLRAKRKLVELIKKKGYAS
jgi:RNA polymerase sigma factor (sigma-70 family)